MTDEELACETQAGSLSAYEELVRRYQPQLLSFLMKWGADHHQAQDLVQVALVTAYQKIHLYKPKYKFSAWVYTIARRKSISHFRSDKPLVELGKEQVDGRTPASTLSEAERADVVWSIARDVLNADQFLMVWLKYHDECPVKDIAEAVGKTESNVKVSLLRARRLLAERLMTREEAKDVMLEERRIEEQDGGYQFVGGLA